MTSFKFVFQIESQATNPKDKLNHWLGKSFLHPIIRAVQPQDTSLLIPGHLCPKQGDC